MIRLVLLRRSAAAVLSLLAVVATVVPGSAQDFFEIVDVPLVEIEVAVIGADGRPVRDLPRDAFQLSVDGQEQEISFFAAPVLGELAEVEQTELRPAHLVILFDNNSIEAQNRNAVIADYSEFLQGLTGFVPQIMVATASRAGLEIEQAFTSDLELIDAALDRVATTAARDRHVTEYESILMDIQRLAGARDPTKRDSTSQAATLVSRIIAFSERARQEGLQTASYIWQLTEGLTGLPGQKSVLYIGGAVSVSPGEALLTALKSMLERSADEWAQKAGAELPAGVASGGSSEIDALSQIASVRGVTVYSFVAGGAAQSLSTGSSASSLTAKDSSTMDGSGSWSPGFDSRTRGESRSALDSLAAATGGFVHAKTGGATPVFDRLHDQMAARYVLGFHPAAGADGQTHEIDVRVEGTNRAVRHRRTFQARTWDDETAAKLRSTLFFGTSVNRHSLELEAQPPDRASNGSNRILLTLRFPLASLAIEPVGKSHRGQASVFVTGGVGRRFELVPVRKSVLPVVLPNEDLEGAMGQMAEYRLELEVPEDAEELAVAIRDDLSTELSVVKLARPKEEIVRVESSPRPRSAGSDGEGEAVPVRLPSAALLMSGQQGGTVLLSSEDRTGLHLTARMPKERMGAPSLAIEAHVYVLDENGDPLSRSARRARLDSARVNQGLSLPLELSEDSRTLSILVRDLESNDFGLVRIPVSPGTDPPRVELRMAAAANGDVDESQAGEEPSSPVVSGGKIRISLEKVSMGLFEVLEMAAEGRSMEAQNRLREMEIELTSGQSLMAIVDLGKQEAKVVASMAGNSWDRMLPLARVWGELIQDYRRLHRGPLSEHAIAMSTQLAGTMARYADGLKSRREAADLLVSLSGYILYSQRLGRTEELLELAVKVDAENRPALLGLAAIREQQGDFEGAMTILNRLLRLSPSNAEGRLRMAVNLLRVGEVDRGEGLLAGLVDDAVEDWIAQVSVQEMARLLASTGRESQAIEILEKAIERWPEEQAMKVQLAWLLDRDNRASEAGEWALQVASGSAAEAESPRFRYHRWYLEGLDDVRESLSQSSVLRAREILEELVSEPQEGGGV